MHPLIPIAIVSGLIAWAASSSSKSPKDKTLTKTKSSIAPESELNPKALPAPPLNIKKWSRSIPSIVPARPPASRPDSKSKKVDVLVLPKRKAVPPASTPEISSTGIATRIAAIVSTPEGKKIFDDMHHQRDIDEVLTALLQNQEGRKIFQGVVSIVECKCITMKERLGEARPKILFSTKEGAQAVAALSEKNYGGTQKTYPCKTADGKILGFHLATKGAKKKNPK